MYSTLIELDCNNFKTLKMLGDMQNVHMMIQDLFNAPRHEYNTQYMLKSGNGKAKIILRSDIAPDVNAAAKHPEIETINSISEDAYYSGLRNGIRIHFSIVLAPTKQLKETRKRVYLCKKEDVSEFVNRKLSSAGLTDPLFSEYGRSVYNIKNGSGEFHVSTFAGSAMVEDVNALMNAIRTGIGRGKAYGIGMLNIAP